MNYTNILLKILTNNRGVNTKKLSLVTEDRYPNIYNYIMNIYQDSSSIHETLKRLPLHIDIKPTCPTCGKPVAYIGKKDNMFGKYCSNSCRAKDPQNYQKWVDGQRRYNLEHYGVEHNFQREDVKEKCISTIKEKYGVDNVSQVKEIKDKIKHTCIKKYGGPSPMSSEEIINKRRQTFLKHYGVNHPLQNFYIKEKIIKTVRERYGVDNAAQSFEIKNKIKQSYFEHYGVDSYFKSDIYKNDILTYREKGYETKRKNHTFNTSLTEIESYNILISKFPNTQKQYRSEQYPFNCDFYIPELDLYIECNYHWTHGGHPYNEANDAKTLLEWQDKSQTSEFYKNAIETWTIRDVKKFETAKQNNLNYKVFYIINELKEWVDSQ